jgi:hypothetical protein
MNEEGTLPDGNRGLPLSHAWQRFCASLERTSRPRAALLAGFLAWGLTTFFYAPPFWLHLSGGGPTPSRVDDFIALCRDPLTRHLFEPILAYRITTPVLAWLLGLRGFSGVMVQYAAIVATLALVFDLLAGRTDRRLALVVTFGIACSYTIIWTNTHPGFPDSVTHLAVALALCMPDPFFIAGMTLLGTLNDERFVLSIPLILLWHAGAGSFSAMIGRTWKLVLGFAAGLAGVILVRHALTVGWIGPGIPRPEIYGEMGNKAASFRPWEGWRGYLLNIPLAYRAFWSLPIFFFLQRQKNLPGPFKLLFLGALLAAIFGCAFVGDVTRSVGFFYPALVLAAWQCHRTDPHRTLQVCVISLLLCLLLPAFHLVFTGNVFWQRPLVFSLLRAWTGWDVLQLFHHAPHFNPNYP